MLTAVKDATTALPNPSTLGTDLERETALVVTKLANVAIASTADLQQAVLDRQDLNTRTKTVQEFFKPFKDLAFKLHRALCDRENDVLAPLLSLDARLKRAITDYNAEQTRVREEAERLEAERRRVDEEARMLAEAAALEQSGDHDLAAATIEQALTAPPPVVVLPNLMHQVEGLKFRTEWKWKFSSADPVKSLALIPRDYLMVDEKRINGYVRSMKGSSKIPGISVYSVQVPVR